MQLLVKPNILPLKSGDVTDPLEIYLVSCCTKQISSYRQYTILKLKKKQQLLLLLCTVCSVGSQCTYILFSSWGYFLSSNHFYEHIWVIDFHYILSRERTYVQVHTGHTCPYIVHLTTGGCLQIQCYLLELTALTNMFLKAWKRMLSTHKISCKLNKFWSCNSRTHCSAM